MLLGLGFGSFVGLQKPGTKQDNCFPYKESNVLGFLFGLPWGERSFKNAKGGLRGEATPPPLLRREHEENKK